MLEREISGFSVNSDEVVLDEGVDVDRGLDRVPVLGVEAASKAVTLALEASQPACT